MKKTVRLGTLPLFSPYSNRAIDAIEERFAMLASNLPEGAKCEHERHGVEMGMSHNFVIEWTPPEKCPARTLMSGKISWAIKQALKGVKHGVEISDVDSLGKDKPASFSR